MMHFCLAGSTVVATRDGIKEIKEVRPGDQVLSASGNWRQVTGSSQRLYSGPFTRVAWYYGYELLKGTSDHEVLAAPRERVQDFKDEKGYFSHRELGDLKWTSLGELGVGDYLVGPTDLGSRGIETPPNYQRAFWWIPEEDLYWLAGLYCAEGFFFDRHEVRFGLGSEEGGILARLAAAVAKYFGRTVKVEPVEGTNGVVVRFSSDEARSFLHQFRTGAHNKRVPLWLLGAPSDCQAEFLLGYWQGDGRENRGSYGFSSVSEKMLQAVQLLLTKLGICSKLKREDGVVRLPSGSSMERTIYRLVVGGQHAARFEEILGLGSYSHRFLKRVFLQDGLACFQITHIEIKPEQTIVYNLEVEMEHSFLANGIISKNCVFS